MNVVLVTHGFPPHDLGDAPLTAFHLAEELSRRAEVHVFAGRQDGKLEPYEIDRELYPAFEVTSVNHPRRTFWQLQQSYVDRSVAYDFDHYLSRVRPDVVHVLSLRHLTASVLGPAKRRGIPVVFSLTDFWPLCSRTRRYARWGEACDKIELETCHRCLYHYALATHKTKRFDSYKRRLRFAYKNHLWGAKGPYPWRAAVALIRAMKDAAPYLPFGRRKRATRPKALERRQTWMLDRLNAVDVAVAPSRYAAEEYLKAGLQGPKVRQIVTGATGRTPERRRSEDGKVRFGFFDAWSESNGLFHLLDAFQTAPSSAELHVFGGFEARVLSTSEESDPVRERCDAIPGVLLHGTFDPRNLMRRLSEIDVLVVPTLGRTNAPLVLFEALAAGIPAIVSEQGGAAEIVRECGGAVLYSATEPDALEGLIASASADLEAFEGRAGRARNVPTLTSAAQQLLEVYRELAGESQPDASRSELAEVSAR
ncbi:MAG: glycosyltransferase [Planctomycetota bacterium]